MVGLIRYRDELTILVVRGKEKYTPIPQSRNNFLGIYWYGLDKIGSGYGWKVRNAPPPLLPERPWINTEKELCELLGRIGKVEGGQLSITWYKQQFAVPREKLWKQGYKKIVPWKRDLWLVW